jgi:hypothetical protein
LRGSKFHDAAAGSAQNKKPACAGFFVVSEQLTSFRQVPPRALRLPERKPLRERKRALPQVPLRVQERGQEPVRVSDRMRSWSMQPGRQRERTFSCFFLLEYVKRLRGCEA